MWDWLNWMTGWWSPDTEATNPWLIAAGAATLVTAVIHLVLGGREVARPLLDSRDINPVAKYTNYYCWHLVSLTIIAMGGSFMWAAADTDAHAAAVVALILSLAFAAWSLALVVTAKQSFIQMPQWVLFCAIAALGYIGVKTAGS